MKELGPTREAKRNHGVVMLEGERGGIEFRSFSDPLAVYRNQRWISTKQFRAGLKLYRLWYVGCIASGYVQMQYRETSGAGRPTEFTPPGFLATDYREAMAAIRGITSRRVAYWVCCEGIKASKFDTRRTTGMDYLRSALDDLAEHFKPKP